MKERLLSVVEMMKYALSRQVHANSFLYFNKLREDEPAAVQIERITHAIALHPDDAQAYYFRGMAYYDSGVYDRAAADFTRSLRLDPDMHQVINCRGMCYYMLGDYDRALADFERTNRADVFNMFVYRADIYSRRGEPERALADLQQALKVEPNNPDIAYRLGRLYYSIGHCEQAIEWMERLLARYPAAAKAHELRGVACLRLHRYEEALRDFSLCIGQAAGEVRYYYYRGLAGFHTKRYEQALADFTQAQALGFGPKKQLLIYLARAELALKHGKKALEWLNAAEQLSKHDARIYYFRGQAYKELGDFVSYKLDLHRARHLNAQIDREAFEQDDQEL